MNNSPICGEEAVCTHLAARVTDHGKGFVAIRTAGKAGIRLLGVAYKADTKDKGLLLNWCPFCGGKPGYFDRECDMPEAGR